MAYELPENLDALTSSEELQALLDAGLDEFQALGITPESDEATIAEGERIAPLISAVRARQQVVETEAAARADRATALLQSMETPVEPEPPAEPETPPVAPPPETPEAPVTPDAVIQPEPVAASAGRPTPARRAAANAAPQVIPANSAPVLSLVAAADVPGIPTGAPLEGLSAAAEAVIARMRGLPNNNLGRVRHRYGAAMIRLDHGELSQANTHDDYALVWAASREARLPGGSLAAAGGWCAPSETLYDLCQYESVDGILSMPEFGITRGGIRWTEGPDFSDIYAACGFFQTEAQAIAGETKECCIVDCPEFDEIRADVVGLCVKAPLLTQAAYPELTRRFLEGALVAHQHKVNKRVIDSISAAAGAGYTVPANESISIALETLELNVIAMRYRYRMSQTATVEVIAPFWFKAMIRADWGMRATPPALADAAINGWFSDRSMSVQWVYDYQDLEEVNCAVVVPQEVELLYYPAGTWSRGRSSVINIDAVYDSTGLEQNIYTALFMEEGILTVQRCTHTCKVTIDICQSGVRGALDFTACLDYGPGSTAAATNATGATAGTPGTWTPAGSNPPESSAALAAGDPNVVVASPLTAWTPGQYVTTDADDAFWSGTEWLAGRAGAG